MQVGLFLYYMYDINYLLRNKVVVRIDTPEEEDMLQELYPYAQYKNVELPKCINYSGHAYLSPGWDDRKGYYSTSYSKEDYYISEGFKIISVKEVSAVQRIKLRVKIPKYE